MGRTSVRVGSGTSPTREEGRPVGLPDAELTAGDVAHGVELDVEPEQGLLQIRLPNLSSNLATGRLAVLAGTLDRAADHLGGNVAGSAEELGIPAVGLLEGLDDRMRPAGRERRGVHAAERGERVVEQAVGAHQVDAALPCRPHLLAERLALRRQLPRDVDDLRVARDLRDQRREVRLLLADAVTRDGDARCPQLGLNRVREARAVGLLVVDDVDALELQLLVDEVRRRRALNRVRRHGAEEVAGPRSVGSDLRVRGGAADEGETGVHQCRRSRLDLVAAGRADDSEDVRGERLGRLDRFSSASPGRRGRCRPSASRIFAFL